jgi:DNA-binding response OmpR family regulator
MPVAKSEGICSTDGKPALSVAAQFSPDVVLLDIGMPSLDG